MTSVNTVLRRMSTGLATLTIPVYHYWRPVSSAPVCIWAEDGSNKRSFADGKNIEQKLTGTVDLFTKTEFDTNIDAIQSVLDSVCHAWRLNSVQYEDETNLIHYEWRWEMV